MTLQEGDDFVSRLPFDIQRKLLLTYLGPEDVVKLCRLGSSAIHDLCKNDEIWRNHCARELSVKPKDLDIPCKYEIIGEEFGELNGPGDIKTSSDYILRRGRQMSYFEAYSRLIYPFRGLVNRMLNSDSSVYGDVMTISFENGLVRGRLWFVPMDLSSPMKAVEDFVVFIHEEIDIVVICNEFLETMLFESEDPLRQLVTVESRQYDRPPSGVRFSFRSHPYSARLRYKLQDHIADRGISWPPEVSFQRAEWCNLQFGEEYAHGRLWDLFDGKEISPGTGPARDRVFEVLPSLKQAYSPLTKTLNLPEGMFKGSYGANGNELVWMWSYNGNNFRSDILTGWKITGDSFVASGKTTFSFEIENAVTVSRAQQCDIVFLEGLSIGPFTDLCADPQPAEQPFLFPKEQVHLLNQIPVDVLPSRCALRFVGTGKLSSRRYYRPKVVVAHLIVFDPTCFMVMWLGKVRAAALFRKVLADDSFHKYAYW